MALAVGAFNALGGNGSATSLTLGITTAGSPPNLLVAIANDHTQAVVSVGPDSAGNKYTLVGTHSQGATQLYLYASQAYNGGSTGGATSGGAITCVVVFAGGTEATVALMEITGAVTATAMIDTAVSAFGSATSNPYGITSGTPTNAAELAMFFAAPDPTSSSTATWTPASGWTSKYYQPDGNDYWALGVAYEQLSSAVAVTPSASFSDGSITWAAVGVIGLIPAVSANPALTAVSATGSVSSTTMQAGAQTTVTEVTATGSVTTVHPGVTIALTGVSSTGTPGTVTTSNPIPQLSPVSTAGTPGTAKANAQLALTGNQTVSSVASVGPVPTLALTAVSTATSVGTLTVGPAPALSGVSSSTSVGSVTVAGAGRALTGDSSSTSVGAVGVSVTCALTGVSSATSVGTMFPPGLNLTNVSSTGTAGTVAPGVAHALSAVSSTSTPGSAKATPTSPISAVQATGSVGTVTFGNIVVGLGGVTAIGEVGNVGPPAPLDFRNGELFMAIQSGVPAYWIGQAPVPNNRGALILVSGTWVVPLGAKNVYVSAQAAGGSPFGLAGQQIFHQHLAVNPGDTLSVTFDTPGNIKVTDGTNQLLYLYAGPPYKKRAWQSTLGQQSGIQGFGSGVDAGTPFPPILVFYWN